MFDRIRAQEPAVHTLRRALETRRVHHAYRFEGPDGVGKELAALALGQALMCEREGTAACGECRSCQRAVTFTDRDPIVPQHPDVVIVQRGLYSPAMLGTQGGEANTISIHQIRKVVLSRSGFPPHEGRALLFIVRDADELTGEAANALLKTLEEPADRTHFVLLTSRPNRLLDTVRSRTLAVRFGPLPDDVVAEILTRHGRDPAVAPLAQGSASLALLLSDEQERTARDEFVARTLAAIDAADLVPAIGLVEKGADRHRVRADLAALGHALAVRARSVVATDIAAAARDAARFAVVSSALGDVERNVTPGLALESMVARLRRE